MSDAIQAATNSSFDPKWRYSVILLVAAASAIASTPTPRIPWRSKRSPAAARIRSRGGSGLDILLDINVTARYHKCDRSVTSSYHDSVFIEEQSMSTTLDNAALDTLFRQAHTHNGWQSNPVSDDLLRQVSALLNWGTTNAK